jgi:sugar phosphate isomerase/epimerase
VHPRLSILSRFHEPNASLPEELEQLHAAGVRRAGVRAARLRAVGLDTAASSVARTGITVTHLGLGGMLPLAEPGLMDTARRNALRAVDAARAVGASSVYGPTGGAPALDWEDAATSFVSGIEPVAAYAATKGLAVLIEPTVPLFADVSILTTLSDTAELAQRAGIGVCVDVQHCWRERGLRGAIRRAAPLTGMVQISDWIPGRRDYVRGVPGEGAVPLERILGWVLEEGYEGLFDLEVTLEPDTPAAETIGRALEAGSTLLDRLGL